MLLIQPPTGTVTFLFTDIEGSTKLWESSPIAMRAALALHDEIVRASIEANGGTVFKTMGDAFCAAFRTAPEAAAAALDAQLSLAAEEWMIEPPVRARMALHTGAADERGGDYFGQPLNRAARLLAAGHGGQTLVSLVTQELIRDSLPGGVDLVDLGTAALKDLARPERVYQLTHPDLPSEFPALRSLSSAELPNNLPQQSTSFIGREREVEDVKRLIGEKRLLTLVGAGGAGKTRLALQAAADLLDGDGDGVWLVELAPLADPSLVPAAVAQALGIAEAASQPMQMTLVNALKAKRLLIVLDNCEHVLAACCSLASDILRSCPDVRLLATSREPLGAAGEQVYRVPSLSVPKPASRTGGGRSAAPEYTAESLSQYDSVRLFIERAKAVQPAFTVSDANAPAVAQLCYRLDGIPLAVELAAARVRSMSVEQINARLDHRFRLLTGGARSNLPRQQTLQALIDWSYDLLSEPERAMLMRLSVFAGGWTLEAAEAVCSGGAGEAAVEEWQVLDLLTSLTDKSLILFEADSAETGPETGEATAGAPRSSMLESIRQYGCDKLAERGESEATQARHRDWCLALAAQAHPQMQGPATQYWLSRLDDEYDNMRAALLWCEQRGGADAALGLQIASRLTRFWQVRGYYAEGRKWLEQALQASGNVSADGSDLARARAHAGIGIFAAMQCSYAEARTHLRSALEINRRLDFKTGIANTLNSLGNVASVLGDYTEARLVLEESLEIKRQMQDQLGIGTTLNALAFAAGRDGDLAAALDYYRDSIRIFREVGNDVSLSNSVQGLASTLADQGEYAEARPLLNECLALQRRLGDAQGISDTLYNLALVANEQGEYAEGRELSREALEMRRQLGDLRGIAYTLSNLGASEFGLGDTAAALELMLESVARARPVGDQAALLAALRQLGELQIELGHLPEARAALEECVALCRQTDQPYRAAVSSVYLAEVISAEGNPANAHAMLLASLAEMIKNPEKNFIAESLDAAASASAALGRHARAVALWSAADTLRERIGAALPPVKRQRRDAQLAEARSEAGESVFAAAASRGRELDWQQAAEYALSDAD